MRTLIFVITLLLSPAAAHADMTIQRAAQEARSFLTPCHYKDVDKQGLCHINEFNFVEQYVRALSGDRSAQGSTMGSFSSATRDPVYDLGEPTNQILACAWATIVLTETNRDDPQYPMASDVVADQCSPLGHDGLAAAAISAAKLKQRLHTNPVHLPPNWDPPEEDLFPPNSRLLPSPTH